MIKYNFGAGPAMMPPEVIKATAQAVTNFNEMGISLMELGHRTPQFKAVLAEAQQLMRELLHVPDNFSILFLGGGARMQFDMVPMNFLNHHAQFIDSGHWAHQAMQAAKLWGKVSVAASSRDEGYHCLPNELMIDHTADYLHLTANNTIYGTEMRYDLDSPIPIVADMTSDILSRPIDFTHYGMVYGGAQKNLSMAGVTFVIVNTDWLKSIKRHLPAMLDYRVHVANGSMYNTPPTLAIYTALQTLRWVKAQGGVEAMQQRAQQRADLLYAEIDRNVLFRGTVAAESRSHMNCCFVLNEAYQKLENDFLQFAASRGIYAIKGHRLVGGFRASIYNAMPLEGVQCLVDCLRDFEAQTLKEKGVKH